MCDGHVLRRALWGRRSKEESEDEKDMEKAGYGRYHEGWFEPGRYT